MCGITGFVEYKDRSQNIVLKEMIGTLRHRGPDDLGYFFSKQDAYQIGLAHSRLSILDVSSAGHQPMTFQSYTITLNGEIYNYVEIRTVLQGLGHDFQSNSDTEVVLHAFAEWGTKCVDRFIGMFAFVIFDKATDTLYMCRDRVGVKPLFYYTKKDLLMFASELKAFHKHPSFEKKISSQGLHQYLLYGYVPEPYSIFENVCKLKAGHWLMVDLPSGKQTEERYWNAEDFFRKPIREFSYLEAQEELEKLLISACNYRLVSDVPVGVFLSGGFDSTLVTALLQKNTPSKLKTFTIGFPDGVNEAPFAKKIADYLGTEHTNCDCRVEDAQALIPELSYYYDEPCADISAIPTLLVSKLARERVTVALSADGGDELFAGYDGFNKYSKQLKLIRKIPFPKMTGAMLTATSSVVRQKHASMRKKVRVLGSVLQSKMHEQYRTIMEEGAGVPVEVVNSLLHVKSARMTFPGIIANTDLLNDERNSMLLTSFNGSLKDLLLVKVDRATMAASLEGREPLLDHRLIEFAAQLPYDYKSDGVTSKRIIRDIVYKYVPAEMMNRPKMGFDLPIYKWLKNDLTWLMEEHLCEDAIQQSEFFNHKEVAAMVNSFKKGTWHYPDVVWRILTFQLWHQRWMK